MADSQRMVREWVGVGGGAEEAGGDCVTVVQFNALAHSLCTASSFPYAAHEALAWERRGQKLVEELLAPQADLIGMEEVDESSYEATFLPALRSHGYDSFFAKKKAEKSADGCVVAWKTSVFDLVGSVSVLRMAGCNQLALLSLLLHRATGKRVLHAVTHLKAKRGFEEVRRTQVAEIMTKVASMQERREGEEESGWDVFIACGDFNDEKTSPAYRYMAEESPVPVTSCYSLFPPPSSSSPASLGKGVDRTADEAPFTTYKQRQEDHITCRTIDYIWVSRNSDVRALLDLPWPPPPTPFPSLAYPSDHVLIGALICLSPS